MTVHPAIAASQAGAAARSVLSVRRLTVNVGAREGRRSVVRDLSFDLARGETLCIAGESGSGKSMTSLAILGLLPKPAARVAAGSVRLGMQELVGLDEAAMRAIRGDRIAMIFQEPMTSLNPVLTVGRQLTEAIRAHRPVGGADAVRQAVAALDAVRIPQAASRMGQYPHELSGGQRQRVMIAMALALEPDVLIADEPTTALDVTVQAQVLGLLKDLQRDLGTAIILITHDMGVVAEMGERVVVMRGGAKVEEGTTADLFARPRTDYTKALLAAVPRIGAGPGRRATRIVSAAPVPAVEVRGLTVRYPVRGGLLGRTRALVHAVEGVSFAIAPGETLSLVGESGCGKSTTAKALAGLAPYAGTITVNGRDMAGLGRPGRKAMRRDVQMIFQDPYASLDPRMTAGALVREPLDIYAVGTKAERRERVAELFERVGLSPDGLDRYPHEFSGGQRQRLSIARALALRPKVIVADESVSALDVSVQARVLDLLAELQAEFGVAYLFISHDMAVVENISDRVAVMYLGQIVEVGTRDQIFGAPRHPYTRRLIDAVPVADPARRRPAFARMEGELPSSVRRIGDAPARRPLVDVGAGHWVAEDA
ncbi:ABC transporter ATP-binding protein [Aureimonas pseudogalii]|uniref:Peptide/nickel transport system ATP-binding protein n=1 Tax=Aureimonas pseudogalii TaxID=1744844 RepID=A0A7W6MKB5_9HYPH|nr:ABC transporter ATP-binding protein [Aureimonas pseudogalii]MBB3998880.1 peptide/nickel transport system ATP-binding protein [Aureimonas pseudogalii]